LESSAAIAERWNFIYSFEQPELKEHVAQLVEQRTFNKLALSENAGENGTSPNYSAVNSAAKTNSELDIDADLRVVIAAWPELPPGSRAEILRIVDTAARGV
jgi:hypothetical protein